MRESPFGPIRLPSKAFKCVICNKVSGECEHTRDPATGKPVRGAKVLVAGLIEGYLDPMDTMFEMGPVTPCPMPSPKGSIFFMEMSPSVVEPADKTGGQ